MERADLFLSTSRHESYGLTTMEALAAGTPVVGVRSYGIEETLDSSCGLMVEPGSQLPARLWAGVRELLLDPGRRARLAQGALKRAQENGFERAAEALESLARSLAPN